jgi:hypothetical protein
LANGKLVLEALTNWPLAHESVDETNATSADPKKLLRGDTSMARGPVMKGPPSVAWGTTSTLELEYCMVAPLLDTHILYAAVSEVVALEKSKS